MRWVTNNNFKGYILYFQDIVDWSLLNVPTRLGNIPYEAQLDVVNCYFALKHHYHAS